MCDATAEVGGVLWHYRPGTNDLGIVRQNFVDNASQMPAEVSGWRVLDIGAHIGSFSRLAALRGAIVDAYEPVSGNLRLLKKNVEGLRVECHGVGVGEQGPVRLFLDPYNTGRNSPSLQEGQREDLYEDVQLVGFPLFVRWDFVKIDIEGGEYALIDELVRRCSQIRCLSISFHEVPGCSAEVSLEALGRVYESKLPIGGDTWLLR